MGLGAKWVSRPIASVILGGLVGGTLVLGTVVRDSRVWGQGGDRPGATAPSRSTAVLPPPTLALATLSHTPPARTPPRPTILARSPLSPAAIEPIEPIEPAPPLPGFTCDRSVAPGVSRPSSPSQSESRSDRPPAPESPLPALCPVTQALPPEVGWDGQLWGEGGDWQADRSALLQAIGHSLQYLATPAARQTYATYPVAGVSHDRVYRSLQRFRTLVRWATSAEQLQRWVRQEFTFYQATGHDGQGSVGFTGYFEPSYRASRTPSAEYRYPLYRRPPDLDRWPQPHPTRLDLEGADGLQGSRGPLAGLELVWLADRLEAYLVQVQGSARLQLVQGGSLSVGYDGRTEYSYTSLGKALVDAGKFSLEELTLPKVLAYFEAFPQDLDLYVPRNDRFIFFRETQGAPPTGSLSVPVTADRSIATDKSLMPPGALALIVTTLPYGPSPDQLQPHSVSRYVLDQDTGGAIKGAGRVDIFLGSGELAGARAGLVNAPGQLYYLLLK